MHRCLLPRALPARARCVPHCLAALNRSSPPLTPWRRTLPLRRFSVVAQEKRVNEHSRKIDALSSVSPEETDGSAQLVWKPEPKLEEDKAESLDIILEGYEKQPTRDVRSARKECLQQAFESYDAHLDKKRPKSSTHQKLSSKLSGAAGMPLKSARQRSPRKLRVSQSERLENALRKQPRMPSLYGRPRFVSIATMGQYSIPALSRVWNYNYAKAQNVFDKLQSGSTTLKDSPLLAPQAAKWVDIVTVRIAEEQDPDIKGLAESYKVDHKILWAHIALWLLHYDKDGLVEFLLATSSSSPLPWVLDCLQVLAAHYAQLANEDTVLHVAKLHKIFCANAENAEEQQIAFDGRFIRRVMPHSTPTQMSNLYRAMRVGGIKVHHNTWMHLASYLAKKNDHFHQALDVLLEGHRAGVPTGSYPFLSVCATLLRRSIQQPSGLRVCLRIVDNLVRIGVTLNTQLCNILILNAVDAGDVKTALGVYQSMVDNNIVADKYTYAILLKCCKLDIDNAELLNQTITGAIEGINVSENPVIATEILHCLTLHHTRNSKENAWATICQAYAQIFELHPLERLGLPISQSVRTTPRAKQPMVVDNFAIGIMLHAYIQLAINGHGSTALAQDMYKLYHALIESRTQPFASTAMSTHCYNAFLMAFIQNKRTLINAAQVIKDMQNLSAESPPKAVAPDAHSWSIFLHGFTRHDQLKLAEQVLSYMRDKGIEPTAVTWNTLLQGYSSKQDFGGVENTLRRFDAGDHVWDEWTYSGLRRFRDSGKLRALMAEKGKPAELDFTRDLKEGLGARLNEEVS